MEREASLLRCSKLSCYAEFNRMVQAIARNGTERGLSVLPGFQSMHGTSAEYSFYTTLSLMLRQVVSNPNPAEQRQDLKQVYSWFHVNKPLIADKTKSSSHKPTLSLTTQRTPGQELERPQTAPATLYQSHSSRTPHRPYTSPVKGSTGRATSAAPKRSFTSSYMSRSLTKDLDQVGVGQPFDRLLSLPGGIPRQQEGAEVGDGSQAQLPPHGQPARSVERSRKSRLRVRALGSGRRRSDSASSGGDSQGSPLNVVNIPNRGTFSSETEGPSLVDFGTVFTLAPSVAAQMTLSRELQKHQHGQLKQALLRPAHTCHGGTSSTPQHRLRMNTPTLGSEHDPTSQHRESSPHAPQGTASHATPQLVRSTEEISSESLVAVNDKSSERADTAGEGVTGVSVHVGGSQITKPPPAADGSTGTTNSQQNGREGDSAMAVEQPAMQSAVGAESVTGDQNKQRDSKRTIIDSKRSTKTPSNHLHQRKRLTTPMNTVCLSFTPAETLRRSCTSSAGIHSKGSSAKVSMAAAGFNRNRYRPKTVHATGSQTGISP